MKTAYRAAALLAVVVLGACGGTAPSAVGVPADFSTKALAVCQHPHELKLAQGPFPLPDFNPTDPDATKFPQVAAALRKTAATWETWLTELEALGEPSTGQGAWDELVAAVQRHRDLNADQIAAAERGDRAAFASDYDAGVRTQADVLKAATAAGVAACAEVDR
jgi:hypothetical protein